MRYGIYTFSDLLLLIRITQAKQPPL